MSFRLDIALIHCLRGLKSHKLENDGISFTFTFFGHPNTLVGLLWRVNEQYLPLGSDETGGGKSQLRDITGGPVVHIILKSIKSYN